MTKLTLKNTQQENQQFMGRAIAAACIVGVLLGILIGRLWYLQVHNYTKYQTLSDNNRVNVLPVTPKRGLIYDRNQVLLAENIPAFSLEITPELITDIDATIDALSEFIHISAADREDFNRQLQYKRHFEGIPIRVQLTEQELANFAVNRHQFVGVNVVAGLIRHYPFHESLAHTLGYVGQIDENELRTLDMTNYSATQYVGKLGIERQFETELHGVVGHQQVETNATGRLIRTLQSTTATSGNDLELTLDQALNQIAHEALGELRGAVVAIEPKTGAILALTSTPSYDPNLFVIGMDNQTYQALHTSREQPLYNRAISGQYPPGSTIKPALGLQGLTTQTITAEQKIFDPGWYQLPNDSSHFYRDWKRTGHGWIDLGHAISESCSTFFYQLANSMGIDAITTALKEFKFGQATGLGLPGEQSGLVPSREWKQTQLGEVWYPGETLITGIGQGYTLVTPIQLAQYTATIANQGAMVQPYMLQAFVNPNGERREIKHPAPQQVAYNDAANWNTIHQAMYDVVNSVTGTAFYAFRGANFKAAGKTGTAQVSSILQGEEYDETTLSEHLRDHHLFIGYAPFDDPQIAVAVITENSRGASDVARQVMGHYLDNTPSLRVAEE